MAMYRFCDKSCRLDKKGEILKTRKISEKTEENKT